MTLCDKKQYFHRLHVEREIYINIFTCVYSCVKTLKNKGLKLKNLNNIIVLLSLT
jgi:hypothetical protein